MITTFLTVAAVLTASRPQREITTGDTLEAIRRGNWEELERIRREVGSFRRLDGPYNDVLSELSRFRDTGTHYGKALTGMRLLIQGGANVNAGDGRPVITMANDPYLKLLERLLQANADPDLYGRKKGNSALMTTICAPRERNTALLLRYKADPNLRSATDARIWYGPGISRPSFLPPKARDASTHRLLPLSVAARLGKGRIVALLLARKAKPNARDTLTGMTPLHEAAEANQPEIVRTLLRAGASRRARDKRGRTALRAARERRAVKAARALGG